MRYTVFAIHYHIKRARFQFFTPTASKITHLSMISIFVLFTLTDGATCMLAFGIIRLVLCWFSKHIRCYFIETLCVTRSNIGSRFYRLITDYPVASLSFLLLTRQVSSCYWVFHDLPQKGFIIKSKRGCRLYTLFLRQQTIVLYSVYMHRSK